MPTVSVVLPDVGHVHIRLQLTSSAPPVPSLLAVLVGYNCCCCCCLLCKVVCVLSIFDEVTQITPGISETHGCRGRSLHRFHCSQPLYARHCTARPLDGWLSCPCYLCCCIRKRCCSNSSGWASTALLGWCHMAFLTPFFLLAPFMWLLLRWSQALLVRMAHAVLASIIPLFPWTCVAHNLLQFVMVIAPPPLHSAHDNV